jgi:hypothetical protein
MTEKEVFSTESSGPATDRSNNPVVDPSQNVLALVDAANRRQDDLRDAQETLRLEQLNHIRDVVELTAEHSKELRIAESARIDAIRAVDQGNVTRASEVAAAQATALAAQLQVSAEALRAQVEATRITTADTLAAALSPIQNDVAVLREVQFRQQGERTAGDDPVVKALADLQRDLYERTGGNAAAVQHKSSVTDNRAFIFSIVGVLFAIAVIISPHIHG